VSDTEDGALAVIGMAGRFPGAADVATLWRNLCDGVESVVVGAPDAHGHVESYGVLGDADGFDADFFGYPPREALIIDPQHRVFLECAYHVLEDAGYVPAAYRGAIGLFAGGGTTRYLAALESQRHRLPMVDDWQLRMATGPDFLATRAAHKLGLRGPVCTVQSGCSTSLVAIHLAAQAVLAGECDMALAGGVTVHVPPPAGLYAEGGILASDGHIRAFDAAATGAIGGSAAALVLLKPLAEALADGDHVHAVVRGTAVNNDGGDKIGFTAPSVDGQARAIRTAQRVAGVDASTIGYVEAHGTGTPLGDPIEVKALTKAFRADTDARGFCALGSVKTNIGHTDAAAGVSGFIKAVLAVEHGVVPPSLNFTTPNPEIDFAASPFVVARELTQWGGDGQPRRAGVSALGIGGTNAHVIVEEPPLRAPSAAGRPYQLVTISARTAAALDAATARMADHLAADPDVPLADVAWTTQVGRRAHPFRRWVVADRAAEAARMLRAGEYDRDVTSGRGGGSPPVVFMFPGQGGQHVGMAAELYAHEPVFRDAVDACRRLTDVDLRGVLLPGTADRDAAVRALETIEVGQPAVFVVEYALAQLWRSWGVHPAAVVGHSLGAYAAACAAGVLSLRDAVRLVVQRGRLLQGLPVGRMLAVELPEAELMPLLPAGVSVGAVNGPGRCTATGPGALIERFAVELTGRGYHARVLRIATAGHSALVERVLPRYAELLADVELAPPEVPFMSEITGRWLTPEEATDPGYWTAHLRRTVRFGASLEALLTGPDQAFLEVGPGTTLVSLARQHPGWDSRHLAVNSLPHPAADASDLATALAAAGRLWSGGVGIDWGPLHSGERRRRVKLPLYPFEHRRFHVEPARSEGGPVDPPERPGPRPADIVPGDGAVEQAVAGAFRDVLGLAEIDAHDDFFDLGGDSLVATQLAAWIRRRFDVPLSAKEIFGAPTVRRLTGLLEERLAGART
jgi:phthiocerol/phenolphthiocerol synthesis type-I polyketide synthase E